MPAPWWVELGLGPLVGRAMSNGMPRGGYGLRKSSGSLSVDGWDRVPALLVIWPDMSQHWSLQAVAWGQVLALMFQARCQPSDDFSQICSPPTFMPQERHSHPLSPQEALQDQQAVPAQVPLKSLLFPCVLGIKRPRVHHPRVESVSPSSVELL